MPPRFKAVLVELADGTELKVNGAAVSDALPLPVKDRLTAEQQFVIPVGGTGQLVLEVDLGDAYKVITIACDNCAGIPAATTMQAEVGYGAGDVMCNLYEENDPSTLWEQGDLPVVGTLAFPITHTFGARRIRLILSNVVTAQTTFRIRGYCLMR